MLKKIVLIVSLVSSLLFIVSFFSNTRDINILVIPGDEDGSNLDSDNSGSVVYLHDGHELKCPDCGENVVFQYIEEYDCCETLYGGMCSGCGNSELVSRVLHQYVAGVNRCVDCNTVCSHDYTCGNCVPQYDPETYDCGVCGKLPPGVSAT